MLENLTIGMALVFLVLIFFLGNLKAAIIAAINIPLALCGAFILMRVSDTPANLISLGAIDFGIIIDTTVIVMENIHRHLSSDEFAHESPCGRILRAAQEVGGPMFFSTLIFVIAFLPLFTMRGVEGAIFSPMSHTYAYALGSAILLAVTLTPVLGSFAFARGLHDVYNPDVGRDHAAFTTGCSWTVLRWPRLTLVVVLVLAAVAASTLSAPGRRVPAQARGGQHLGARHDAADDLARSRRARLTTRMRRVFMSFPEVTTVVSQLGRPDDGTETTGFFNIEFSVDLKPQVGMACRARQARTRQADGREAPVRELPGVSFDYSQNIEDNVDEALSGVKGSNSVKVFGHDLEVDERIANQLVEVMGKVRGDCRSREYIDRSVSPTW